MKMMDEMYCQVGCDGSFHIQDITRHLNQIRLCKVFEVGKFLLLSPSNIVRNHEWRSN